MHTDIYNVCGVVVGMDVEFVKLVCVGYPLEVDNSRQGVENFLILRGLGGKVWG